MKIYKTMFVIEGESAFRSMDTIQYEGKMWLVPEWLDIEKTKPARIILLDVLPHQKTLFAVNDFALNDPIPKAVLNGKIPSKIANKYIVVEKPHIYPGSYSVH